ncbi:hypothetical protein EOD40_09385 [Flavobacterium sufflavum]|uniref:Uncharacterized protein n=1 Tax=Flavobacterium sufflavum TaxID=1921138 RepID=A0A437KWE1_9FLAO|nr:hypothetical protein [Flavobacterium sufflavum]RVT76701.1 hypothetical protein EOD40_09385 [Flavobacterium sufflavum]
MDNNIGLDNRGTILTASLLLENLTSVFLAQLLGIKDYKKTKSFGNKSGNISFNQKIELLIDMDALAKKEKAKFLTFMEIRNQFMHNLGADDFVSCFENLEGKEKYILSQYPQPDNLSREEKLKQASIELSNELIKTAIEIFDKVKEKIGNDLRLEVLEKFKNASFAGIAEVEQVFNDYIKLKSVETDNISTEELKDVGTTIRKVFYASWKKHFEKE